MNHQLREGFASRSTNEGVSGTLRKEWPLVVFCICVAAVALLYNLSSSPDVLYDEAAYTWAAQQVALASHLTLDNEPLFVHPPMSFLFQAGWLLLTNHASSPLQSAIHAARVLAASVGIADVLLVASLVYKLTQAATPRRRQVLTGITATLTALDPVLVRYDRQNVIEPFALCVSLITLHFAWRLKDSGALSYVAVIGLLGGLSLLTNEIAFFLIIVPLIFALLERSRSLIRRSVAALAIALGFLLLFAIWALELGLIRQFLVQQTITLLRLIGVIQTTGLNIPGISLVGSLERSLSQYLSSYLVLLLGAVALVWYWSRKNSTAANFVAAWTTASYLFGAYIAAVGTLNEQFFVYLMPGCIVGSVLFVDAMVAGACRRLRERRTGQSDRSGYQPRGPVFIGLIVYAGVFLVSATSWVTGYTTPSDGVARVDNYIASHLPACAAVNASGDPQKYSLMLNGRNFAYFAVGPAALADGVHYFILSPTDAVEESGNMTPAFESWIEGNGTRIADYPSQVYTSVQLWYVPSSPYDAATDSVDIVDGVDINTSGSHCGGFTVLDNNTGNFYSGYLSVGGKGMVGDPLSRVATLNAKHLQLFDGVVLETTPKSKLAATAMPIVEMLAKQDPKAYQKDGLPRVRLGAAGAEGRSWLTNKAISRAYLGTDKVTAGSYAAAVQRFGEPLGPPEALPGGEIEQAFADVVLEAPVNGGSVHAVTVTPDVIKAGLLKVPASATATQADEQLPVAFPLGKAEPTSADPFVLTLTGALMVFGCVVLVFIYRRTRRPARGTRMTADRRLHSSSRPDGDRRPPATTGRTAMPPQRGLPPERSWTQEAPNPYSSPDFQRRENTPAEPPAYNNDRSRRLPAEPHGRPENGGKYDWRQSQDQSGPWENWDQRRAQNIWSQETQHDAWDHDSPQSDLNKVGRQEVHGVWEYNEPMDRDDSSDWNGRWRGNQ